MIMVLTGVITNYEKKRFAKLQEEGFLPSEALTKLEAERRSGITQMEGESFGMKKENFGFYLVLGIIGLSVLYIYIKSSPTTTVINKTKILTIDDIQGIDLEALHDCQMKGLM